MHFPYPLVYIYDIYQLNKMMSMTQVILLPLSLPLFPPF